MLFSVFDPSTIHLRNALRLDGVLLLAKTFKELGLNYIQSGPLECALNGTAWVNGISITNFIRNVNFLFCNYCAKCNVDNFL